MKITCHLQGVDTFRKTAMLMGRETPKEVERSIAAKAGRMIRQATHPLVPVKTGALRASGHVYPVEKVGNNKFRVTVGYGGGPIKYAWAQHENRSYNHPVGQAKYLETGARIVATRAAMDLTADIVSKWKAASK